MRAFCELKPVETFTTTSNVILRMNNAKHPVVDRRGNGFPGTKCTENYGCLLKASQQSIEPSLTGTEASIGHDIFLRLSRSECLTDRRIDRLIAETLDDVPFPVVCDFMHIRKNDLTTVW
jgi:hypothetical protein